MLLPVEGTLIIRAKDGSDISADLKNDGRITDKENKLLGKVTVMVATDSNGHEFAYAGPVQWRDSRFDADTVAEMVENDKVVLHIDVTGVGVPCAFGPP